MMRLFNLGIHGSWKTGRSTKLWVTCNIVLGLIGLWGLASAIGLSVACSSLAFILDSAAAQCRDQVRFPGSTRRLVLTRLKLFRWRLVAAFDIFTEVILVSLPVAVVWPLQMSVQRKSQVVLAFAFRLPVAVFAGLHLHYVGNYVHATHIGFAIVPALVWQQIELCWSLLSASIPNLKSFLKTFNSGFGLDADYNTDGYGMRAYSDAYQMESLKSKGNAPQKGGDLTQREFEYKNFRPDFAECSTTVQHENGNANRGQRDASSITSTGSQSQIIRKDIQYNIRYEQGME